MASNVVRQSQQYKFIKISFSLDSQLQLKFILDNPIYQKYFQGKLLNCTSSEKKFEVISWIWLWKDSDFDIFSPKTSKWEIETVLFRPKIRFSEVKNFEPHTGGPDILDWHVDASIL